MNRSIFHYVLLLCVLFTTSCATSKEARNYKKSINGNWTLQTIVTEGVKGKVKITLFNEAELSCFIASKWNFNNMNSYGTYSIQKSGDDCAAQTRNMRWTIYEATGEPKLLQFKRLDDKLKALDDGNGYRFIIANITNSGMQLKSEITFENLPVTIIYNFIRS